MLKKLWLVMAASALVAAGQVSATTQDVTEEDQEIVLTQEEIDAAAALAQDIIDGKVTAADLAAVETLQQNRNKRSQLIKTIVVTALGLAVVAGGGYLVYNKWFKKDEAEHDLSKCEKHNHDEEATGGKVVTRGGKAKDKKDKALKTGDAEVAVVPYPIHHM
ncbi:hypothetical protein FJ364_01960 [Candidatus Dependentiae bacterium]|nr:hypothetical protein [Candidatus Dependentiae bacterium]